MADRLLRGLFRHASVHQLQFYLELADVLLLLLHRVFHVLHHVFDFLCGSLNSCGRCILGCFGFGFLSCLKGLLLSLFGLLFGKDVCRLPAHGLGSNRQPLLITSRRRGRFAILARASIRLKRYIR